MGTTVKGAFRNIAVTTALAVLLTSATKTFAIEGLKIAVQSGTNVVLWWPSVDGETYLIQYRPSLDPNTPWQTLADYYYPASGTNITSFVHSDIVRYPPAGPGGTNTPNITPQSMSMMGMEGESTPMTTAGDDLDNSVPLALYPPGFDLSGLTIIDPISGESVSGEGYEINEPLSSSQINQFQPMWANGVSENTNQYTGFYQVVRDGAHMFGVTNGAVWSDKVNVPLEVANPADPSYGTLMSVMIEAIDPDTGIASPIGNSQQPGPFNGPLVATVDTTIMSNGTYNLQAYAHWEDGSGAGEWEAVSQPVSVTTSNEITFENFMPRFGNPSDVADFGVTDYSLIFNATSAHTNVNWTVDFYDSSSNYVGSVSGHSPDGNISFTWDLKDAQGIAHTNDAFFNSKISTDYIDPPAPTFWKNSDPWLGPGQWAIAGQHVFEPPWYNLLGTESDALYNEMDEFVLRAGGNGGLNVNTPANQIDGSAYTINGGSAGGAANWAAFRRAIYHPLTRNLVYFGHGGPTGLGWNSNNTSVFIPVTEIAQTLGNMNGTNHHAYRFAFIDACDTANGNLCSALGIMQKQDVSFNTYTAARIRPGAYCGWPSAKSIAMVFSGSVNHDHINYMKHLQFIWYFYPQTIHVAAVQAAGFNDSYGMLNNDLVINGYWGLLPTAYNH